MRKSIFNIAFCTVMILVFTMFFGYTFSLVREIEAADFYHNSAKNIGREFEARSENTDGAGEEEVEEAELVKGFIRKSLKDSGIFYDVAVDYEGHGIVVRTLTDGVVDALGEGDGERWDSICETARECSSGWQETLDEAGLENWHFAVVVLNDYYPKNALLICVDGKTTYDCMRGETEEWT